MKVNDSIQETQHWATERRLAGKSVGVVPTMGALHEGHLSLVRRSLEQCDVTIATVFVNPTQFGPSEDLDRYPRTLDEDLQKLQDEGADYVFTPTPEEIYPTDFSTYILPPDVARPLEGLVRSSHFRGVTTVVLKLLNITAATNAYFGQKDFQQAAVISAMCRDLNMPVKLDICPIVREADGLAMSSRNRYLSSEQRARSLGLIAALREARQCFDAGVTDADRIENEMRRVMTAAKVDSIDYVVVVDRTSLLPLASIDRDAVALVAAHVGNTRLIDNLLLPQTDS